MQSGDTANAFDTIKSIQKGHLAVVRVPRHSTSNPGGHPHLPRWSDPTPTGLSGGEMISWRREAQVFAPQLPKLLVTWVLCTVR
jgi:hypothetical protein